MSALRASGSSPGAVTLKAAGLLDVDAGEIVRRVSNGEGLLSNNLTGSLLRFAPGADEPEVIASEGLVSPTSVALDDDGTIYVSNFGYFPSDGQVVRIAPPA